MICERFRILNCVINTCKNKKVFLFFEIKEKIKNKVSVWELWHDSTLGLITKPLGAKKAIKPGKKTK